MRGGTGHIASSCNVHKSLDVGVWDVELGSGAWGLRSGVQVWRLGSEVRGRGLRLGVYGPELPAVLPVMLRFVWGSAFC